MNPSTQLSLWQACAGYLKSQAGKSQPLVLQELTRFTSYMGADRVISAIAPLDIEKYCESLEAIGDERGDRLNITKDFLKYLFKEGASEGNLAAHAKLRRVGRRGSSQRKLTKQPVGNQLTPEGYQRLNEELTVLKSQRPVIAEQIRKAASTKDFSENSPLDAAREIQGQAESRIRDLESLLRGATILDGANNQDHAILQRVSVGSKVILKHAMSGKEVAFMLVDSSETDPASGKISDASPVGRALLDRVVGDKVEVVTPRGTVQYVLSKIGA
ncbi:MAG: transcription elongation factor GreA [Chloroflexi bacterium]|nr:transcription elongation factor GreA [Chloroflexota bacterium]